MATIEEALKTLNENLPDIESVKDEVSFTKIHNIIFFLV